MSEGKLVKNYSTATKKYNLVVKSSGGEGIITINVVGNMDELTDLAEQQCVDEEGIGIMNKWASYHFHNDEFIKQVFSRGNHSVKITEVGDERRV